MVYLQKYFPRFLVEEYNERICLVPHPTLSNIVLTSLLVLPDGFHILQNLCGYVSGLLKLGLARPSSHHPRRCQDSRRLVPPVCNLDDKEVAVKHPEWKLEIHSVSLNGSSTVGDWDLRSYLYMSTETTCR